MAPMTDKIDQAMARLSNESQSGVADLVSIFSASIQGSVGAELQQKLQETERGIQGSGKAFGRRMAEAASGKSANIEAAMGQIFGQPGGQIQRASAASRTT
jgi:hypothetical protein